jgi:hypothetical protein
MNIPPYAATEVNIVNDLQNSPASPAAEIQRAEEQAQAQPSSPDVQVDVNINNIPNQESANETSIRNSEQAQQAASNVVELFQRSPELAVSAQGGRLTAEKASAAVSVFVGNQGDQKAASA